MNKIVNPCECRVWSASGRESIANAYAKIEYEDGRLSICGVVGPMSNGDCKGGAGQCIDEISAGYPNRENGWSDGMLAKFCDIWRKWHLNESHPECEHQRELGWPEMANEKISLYHYVLTNDACKIHKEAKDAAIAALKAGETFTPTKEQTKFANLKYFYDTYDKITDDTELAKYYKPYRSCIDTPEVETKTRGWVRFDENPKGILCKPCPVCGYKYGSEWKKVDVPQDVIDWLFALPDTTRKPAWV